MVPIPIPILASKGWRVSADVVVGRNGIVVQEIDRLLQVEAPVGVGV